MTKIPRNAPCPCGSGKKYKKCCLRNEQRNASSMSTAPPDPASDVAALETAEIVRRLRELGVDSSSEAYLELARNRTSAWDLSDLWRHKTGPLSQPDDDFIGIAACELWKRYCPQRPSMEMLDDWMQEGYDLMIDGQGAQACDRWSAVWEIIHPRLKREMRTCQSASIVFSGTEVLYNWVQDFQLELYNAALNDTRYADTGIRLCRDVLAQFPDEDELFHINFRADLGEFYYMADRPEEGERVLLDLIRDHPDRAAGYARLADILAFGLRRYDGPRDTTRARALLEAALARPVTDAAEIDLQARLDELRNLSHGASGDPPRTNP